MIKIIQKRKTQKNVHFLDLENIIPEKYWGLTNRGRKDVFHFTDEGHQRLGMNMCDHFLNQLIEN